MLNTLLGKSDFARSVLTLLTGTAFAQAIPLIISPVLTRLYSPDEFGAYALYTAIVSVLVVVATGQYENAVLLPKKELHAFSLVALAGMLTAGFSVFVLVVVVCLGDF
ncbi:MAG: oligosaccharide flippase family protein, partial [Comamonas sp.]